MKKKRQKLEKTIPCRVCLERVVGLVAHLKEAHDLTTAEYLSMFSARETAHPTAVRRRLDALSHIAASTMVIRRAQASS